MADATSSTISDLWGEWVRGTETSPLVKSEPRSNELGKDAFLQLLITQLQYQDPTSPVDDKQFIAQMAQFSALEQMQNMNKAYAYSQSFSMIGKTVSGEYYDEAKGGYMEYEGRVDSVTLKNNEPYLLIGGNEVKMSSVQHVYEDYMEQAMMASINNNIFNAQNIALIGKMVQALQLDDSGKPVGYVEGRVETLRFVDGKPILVVNGKEVKPQEVAGVGEDNMLLGKTASISVLNDAGTANLTMTGAIQDVRVRAGKAYVVIDGREACVGNIGDLTAALGKIGMTAQYGDEFNLSGTITRVLVKGEKVYVTMDDGYGTTDVLYSDIKIGDYANTSNASVDMDKTRYVGKSVSTGTVGGTTTAGSITDARQLEDGSGYVKIDGNETRVNSMADLAAAIDSVGSIARLADGFVGRVSEVVLSGGAAYVKMVGMTATSGVRTEVYRADYFTA